MCVCVWSVKSELIKITQCLKNGPQPEQNELVEDNSNEFYVANTMRKENREKNTKLLREIST